jgi:hypothetical protein
LGFLKEIKIAFDFVLIFQKNSKTSVKLVEIFNKIKILLDSNLHCQLPNNSIFGFVEVHKLGQLMISDL